MITIIAAVSDNGVIGNKGQLLWHISEDMRRFRDFTTGNTVIMGRKTWESIGHALPNRQNIVVTRCAGEFKGALTAHSISSAISMAHSEDIFIIGGGDIYSQSIDIADKMYITRVHMTYDGDTLFPNFDSREWKLIQSEYHDRGACYPYPFTFEIYNRVITY